MTDKQRKFCDEYLIDLNATRAYKLAYPNVKSESAATSGASRLLRNVKVKTYIDEQLEKISSEKIATAEEVMEYLTTVLRGESQSEIVVVEGVGDGCSVARTMKKAPDERDKMEAAKCLGKRYGLFTDKVEVNGVARVVINGEDDLDE